MWVERFKSVQWNKNTPLYFNSISVKPITFVKTIISFCIFIMCTDSDKNDFAFCFTILQEWYSYQNRNFRSWLKIIASLLALSKYPQFNVLLSCQIESMRLIHVLIFMPSPMPKFSILFMHQINVYHIFTIGAPWEFIGDEKITFFAFLPFDPWSVAICLILPHQKSRPPNLEFLSSFQNSKQ